MYNCALINTLLQLHKPAAAAAATTAESRKQRAPRPPNPATRAPAPLPTRQPAPLPPMPRDCDKLNEPGGMGSGEDEKNDATRTEDGQAQQQQQCFIQLEDSKLFANESSNC